MPTTTDTRRDTLVRLVERHLPDNGRELLDEQTTPPFALVASGPDGNWISLHQSGQDALDYLRTDDSDYEPRSLVHLDSGEERLIEVEVNYRIADAAGAFVS